ncbi:c-type cytochrome domain-containing protein [Haloferula chungangensis]|uniref:C-type cytochrome domain-containing protein n=1 Tax=Haloferula chungangensis TaxID=1048331 RepID=A0ABW2L8W7_9BACT
MNSPLLIGSLFLTLPAIALDYEKDVMPIFKAKCYDCHSADAKKIKGGLRLDDPDHFYKRFGKNDVVIPGDWDASYLFVTVTRPHDDEQAMPPEGKGDPLTPEEIMTVANWIHEGAKIGREKGDKGDEEMDPARILKFKDGVLLTEQFVGEEAEPQAGPAPREWTNQQGVTIIATFMGLKDGKAHLLLENGTNTYYPLSRLSEESQAEIKKLSGE